MMKTRIDAVLSQFIMNTLDSGVFDQDEFQELLDFTRIQFGLDVVYTLEAVSPDNIFTYGSASVSKPEYDNRGVFIRISEKDVEEVLNMYDKDPVCDYNVNSIKEYAISDCIIHYGFVRKSLNTYDGSIGFQCFFQHTWSEEEKSALSKLGNFLKMYFSVGLSEGINEHLHRRLNQERKQYRNALVRGSEYSFSFDITEGILRHKIITAHGFDILDSLGLPVPCTYDEANEEFLRQNTIQLVEESMIECFCCDGLLNRFNDGISNPEVEYYNPKTDEYIRVVVFMHQDDETGHVYGLFVASNITKIKKMQEQQRQAMETACEAANQANVAKTKFLANMSHDIRTPLNGIIGMTAIASAHLDNPQKLKDCLAKITVSGRHLVGLINEVLDMSKIESGKMELQNDAFSLPDLVDGLLDMCKQMLEQKHHRLILSIKEIEHEKVIGDSQRLQQAFMNLMSNSIKYTQDGGTIKLSITEKPPLRDKFACYEFLFEDNGIGMSEEFKAKLFEPFIRAEDERMNNVQGTGLGLTITKYIIQMMHGTIQVESQLNHGTKFLVTLFLEIQTVDEMTDCEWLGGLPVLVVDDDEDACLSICQVLSEIGMRGEYVLSGKEAVKCVADHHESKKDYFAVILDWKMPGMNGVETAREIRKHIDDTMPIIILSAYDWSDIEHEARAAGCNAFISKPLFKSRLLHLFHELRGQSDNELFETPVLEKFQQRNFAGKRALLVEDNELNAEIAGEILGMAGLEVEYAQNGQEAVNMMSRSSVGYYDIIFMDIKMPIMDGYEATQAIRILPGNYPKRIPILAMTANAFLEDALAAKQAGMNEHISKPIDFDQLMKSLERWLD